MLPENKEKTDVFIIELFSAYHVTLLQKACLIITFLLCRVCFRLRTCYIFFVKFEAGEKRVYFPFSKFSIAVMH